MAIHSRSKTAVLHINIKIMAVSTGHLAYSVTAELSIVSYTLQEV